MDLEPGRIGFMSTHRRENRWQRSSCTHSAGAFRVPGDGNSSPEWKVSEHTNCAPAARHGRAYAKVGTAPPGVSAYFHPSDQNRSPGSPEQLATNSVQSDHRKFKLVQQNIRRSSPPAGAGYRAAFARLATHRSSFQRIPSPSGFDCLHPTLPHLPAGERRWMERYDGKGNLHLLYAA